MRLAILAPISAELPTDLSFGTKVAVVLLFGTPAVLACVHYIVSIWKNTRPSPSVAEKYATKDELAAAVARIEKLERDVDTELRSIRQGLEEMGANVRDTVAETAKELRETIGQVIQAQGDLNLIVGELRGAISAINAANAAAAAARAGKGGPH